MGTTDVRVSSHNLSSPKIDNGAAAFDPRWPPPAPAKPTTITKQRKQMCVLRRHFYRRESHAMHHINKQAIMAVNSSNIR